MELQMLWLCSGRLTLADNIKIVGTVLFDDEMLKKFKSVLHELK